MLTLVKVIDNLILRTEGVMSKPVTKLKKIRESRFLNQAELADLAGVSRPTVITAERGGKISLGSIKALAAALCIKPEKLL